MAQYRVYKPKKDFKGAATKWESNIKEVKKNGKSFKEVQMFLAGANQTGEDKNGNASFDWKSKEKKGNEVTMKLGDPDVGEILALLNRRKNKLGNSKSMGLFHQNLNGNTSLQIEFKPADDKTVMDSYYTLRLASKDKAGKVTVVQHTITLAEAEIIKNLLEGGIRRKYAT